MTTNIIIAALIVSQIVTCGLSLWVYRVLSRESEDIACRIDFVLDALDCLRDYLKSHSFETDERIAEMQEEREQAIDFDDPDWWRRG
jgi:hypothetical protein